MSRSEYTEDGDNWQLIKWRGAVMSAIRGRRGQAFLREMLEALDAMEAKRLVSMELEKEGEVCALGAVGRKRGITLSEIDPEDHEKIANTFGISDAMAREIMYENDEHCSYYMQKETAEERYKRMRAWVIKHIAIEEGKSVDA